VPVAAFAFATATLTATASAQGLFDFLFGGWARQAAPPPPALPRQAYGYANPGGLPAGAPPESLPAVGSGRAVAFCVRLCDGRYFPIERYAAAPPAQLCSAMCPATRTKIFSGGAIDDAFAKDGTRYADLPNAYLYRDKLVADCTCNGKDVFGLAKIEATKDPTLRPGDLIATDQGLMAYRAGKRGNRQAEFTRVRK
jgi:hypothetical protein